MDTRRIGIGAVAGVIGGLVFGVMMQMMAMMPMVGMLVGQESVAVGWVVHLFNSAVIGAVYGATLGQLHHTWGRGAVLGLVYGAVWWVVGALLIMPLSLGMPALQVGQPQVMSLVGHLMYGLATGLVFTAALRPLGAETATNH